MRKKQGMKKYSGLASRPSTYVTAQNTAGADTSPELNAIIREMNRLGIPTQQQADENPEYRMLRSHYAEEEARQNPAASATHDLVQPSGSPDMKFHPGYVGIIVVGFLGAMTALVFGRLYKRIKRNPTHRQ